MGGLYLEKIVQVVHDIPAIREVDLSRVLADEINRIIGQAPTDLSTNGEFRNVFHTVIRPCSATFATFDATLDAPPMTRQVIGDEVRLTDVLASKDIPRRRGHLRWRLACCVRASTTASAGRGIGKGSDEAGRAGDRGI